MRGAELNPRLRAVFIMPEQLLNLRRRAALPVLGLLHPFSKPDSSLTGNQGVAHTLTLVVRYLAQSKTLAQRSMTVLSKL